MSFVDNNLAGTRTKPSSVVNQASVSAGPECGLRNWLAGGSAPIKYGSAEHLELFCRMLLETHDPYQPAVMEWPRLSSIEHSRLVSLPIWDIAVQTEGRAAIRVRAFAQSVADPLLRQALELDADEEARHKHVLSRLVSFYGIVLEPEPPYLAPHKPEWAWLVTGYSECIDSFFAFGLFEFAKRSGFFPADLVATFEPVIQEEARHILFFVNWVAWHRRNMRPWRRLLFELRVIGVWIFLIWERIGIARGLDSEGNVQDANFAMRGSGSVGAEVTARQFLETCLVANDERMAGYDQRLLRPVTVPRIANWVRRWLRKS